MNWGNKKEPGNKEELEKQRKAFPVLLLNFLFCR